MWMDVGAGEQNLINQFGIAKCNSQEDIKMVRKDESGGKGAPRDDVLFIGISLGTSRTAISGSNGVRKVISSLVGWPKDVVARKFLKKDIVFGDDVLKNRLALDYVRPLSRGVIVGSDKGADKEIAQEDIDKASEGVKELIRHAIDLGEPKGYPKIFGVVGAPSRASKENKHAILDAANDILDAVMVVPEPFALAYGTGKLDISLVIDIGAGTADLCRIYGSLPTEEDQRVTYKAGDHIDKMLMELVVERYPDAQVTIDMARRWKEDHGFVGETKKKVTVEFPIKGVPQKCEITEEMREACESIVPDMAAAIKDLISMFHPEFQAELRNNIILGGGSSQIADLDKAIEEELEAVGGGKVYLVDDPVYAGADGSLKLAQDMPNEYWNQLL